MMPSDNTEISLTDVLKKTFGKRKLIFSIIFSIFIGILALTNELRKENLYHSIGFFKIGHTLNFEKFDSTLTLSSSALIETNSSLIDHLKLYSNSFEADSLQKVSYGKKGKNVVTINASSTSLERNISFINEVIQYSLDRHLDMTKPSIENAKKLANFKLSMVNAAILYKHEMIDNQSNELEYDFLNTINNEMNDLLIEKFKIEGGLNSLEDLDNKFYSESIGSIESSSNGPQVISSLAKGLITGFMLSLIFAFFWATFKEYQEKIKKNEIN